MDLIIETATKAYERHCKAHGAVFQQPCKYASEVGRKFVHLRNATGDLAKYDIRSAAIIDNKEVA